MFPAYAGRSRRRCAIGDRSLEGIRGTLIEQWQVTAIGEPLGSSSSTPDRGIKMRDMSRAKLMQIWVAAVAPVAIATVVLGARGTVATAAAVVALRLVPPGSLLL